MTKITHRSRKVTRAKNREESVDATRQQSLQCHRGPERIGFLSAPVLNIHPPTHPLSDPPKKLWRKAYIYACVLLWLVLARTPTRWSFQFRSPFLLCSASTKETTVETPPPTREGSRWIDDAFNCTATLFKKMAAMAICACVGRLLFTRTYHRRHHQASLLRSGSNELCGVDFLLHGGN